MTARPLFYPTQGGIDQETPSISIPPGRAIAANNHEAVSRGYQRTQGYERYDGRAAPSAAKFSVATFTEGALEIEAGDTLTGLASGAVARVLAAPVVALGAWESDNAAGTIALHNIAGQFVTGETLLLGDFAAARMDAPPVESDGIEYPAYLLAAQTYRRDLIERVPGSGPVRGVVWYEGRLHAWRDNAAGDACVLHQSTGTGWTAPDLGAALLFEGGSIEIVVGDTVTGTESGATGTVRYIVVDAGTDWGSDATGTMILDGIAGEFVESEPLAVGENPQAVAVGPASPVTFPPGGRYEFTIKNFYGTVGTERVYGANGVGPAFEYDGTNVISIDTGMPDDRPFLVAAHKNHLFLGFPKGSLQHSDLGEPRSFTAVLGAAELGMGHELTGIIPNAQATLLITTDSTLGILTGNDSSDWLLEGLSDEAGGRRHSAQRIGQIIYLDERGVRSVAATQSYGNFRLGTYTSMIQSELEAKRKRGAKPVGSCIIKSKDQYLLFFDDRTGISIYFGRKKPEPMLFEYPFEVSCLHVAEVDGRERAFVGATDGFVYELNVGTSFDGAAIEAYLQLPFAHQGGPRTLKRYHKAVADIIAGPQSQLAMVAQFDGGAGIQPYSHSEVFGISGGGGMWGLSNWAEFQWDSPTIANAESYIQGLGVNMSLVMFSSSATMESYIIQGITLMFTTRGMKR
jgi:hypothetical protein